MPQVFLVLEEEPETSTGFPCVVLDVYDSQEKADARVRLEREKRGLQDDADYEQSDVTWDVEPHEVL
jgi:hypothetical protein